MRGMDTRGIGMRGIGMGEILDLNRETPSPLPSPQGGGEGWSREFGISDNRPLPLEGWAGVGVAESAHDERTFYVR